MATFEYSVDGQSIVTTKAGRLVSGTIGVNTVKFTFDSSWSGLEKWATFDPNPGKPYKQPLDANGECLIPGEVMGGITLRIGAFGLADGQAYPTVWANKLTMEEGCFIEVPVSDWPEPAPIIEEILEELENKVDKPENATVGNVAVIGSNQNIVDSGVSKDNLLIAPQLASNNVKTDSVPYKYRQTGGGIGVGNREYDSIVGGSVVHQQIVNPTMMIDRSALGVTLTRDGNGGITVTGTPTATNNLYFINGFAFATHVYLFGSEGSTANHGLMILSRKDTGGGVLLKVTTAQTGQITYFFTAGEALNVSTKPYIYDLTEMFGTAVADRLYAMEQASAGSGIAVLHAMGLNQYRPYTATPSLESVSGLSSHQMKDGNGNVIAEYPLDSSLTLRGVVVLDDNNNIKFDGDTYAPDGTVTRKYGYIDMGTISFANVNSTGIARSTAITGAKVDGSLIAIGYTVTAYGDGTAWADLNMVISMTNSSSAPYLRIKNSAFVGKTTAEVATMLSGQYLLYELQTSAYTTETAEPYESLQICDPLGTEEYVCTAQDGVIVPVGHNTKYPTNQVAKLDGLPSDFSTLIAPVEVTFKATRAYTTGRLLIVNNVLYKATTSIASGATLTVGTNIVATTLDEVIASL